MSTETNQDESINFICESEESFETAVKEEPENNNVEPASSKDVIEGESEVVAVEDADKGNNSANEQGEGKKPNGVQKRINELTKEKEEFKRKFEAEQAKNKTQDSKEPEESDFENYDDYLSALDDFNVSLDVQAENPKAENNNGDQDGGLSETQQEAFNSLSEKITSSESKPKDFEAVALSNDVPITGEMLEALNECEDPVKVMYHLGNNKQTAADIASKKPAQQMKEILKLDLSVDSKPAKPAQITNAPDVIDPVDGSDTIKKSLSEMSFSEFEAEDRARNKKRSNTW